MNNKTESLKEKLRQALSSTARVISDDLGINPKKNIKNSIFLSISVIFGIFILLYGAHNNENEKAGLGLWMYLFALCVLIWEMLSSWSEVDTSRNAKLNFFKHSFRRMNFFIREHQANL